MEDRRSYDGLLTGRASVSPDPWLRSRAALAAGRLKDPEATPYLSVLLADPEPTVRRAAAFAAGISGDSRLVRFLSEALRDTDAGTASAAAGALGRLGGDAATAALLAALSSGGDARPAFVQSLWRLGEPRVVAALSAYGADPGRPLRKAAVYALARRPRPESAALLRRALGDDDAENVAWAARGLGVLGDAGAGSELSALAWSQDASVAVQSLLALEKIGVKGTLPDAARRAGLARDGDHQPGVAVAALRLLGRFPGDREVAGRLEEVVREGGWRGQTALVSLASVDAERVASLLAQVLGGESLELRLGAAEAVGALPPTQGLALARKLLADPRPRVRATALSSLPKEAWADDALSIAGLKDADPSVRAVALEAVAPSVPGRPAVDVVWEAAFGLALREKEPDFAVSALDAAAQLRSGGRERLEAKVDDPDAIVREKARRLLVEKLPPTGKTGVARPAFRQIPVTTRYASFDDYRRLAREANESTFFAVLTTARGSIGIDLAMEDAPITVATFRELAARHFFDGMVIHRVVPDFVVQLGDPRGDGSGGPGFSIRDELNPLPYRRGTVGMALSGPDTGGSQWFIALSAQPHLDGVYTVFGQVSQFIEVADRTEQDDVVVSVTVEELRRERRPWGAR
jgi:cyclophilin family peptidyl-prolyl cis-trans isomerase/HEAT repeat protein